MHRRRHCDPGNRHRIMFDFAAAFANGLAYHPFLEKYGTAEQRRRWQDFHAGISLKPAQQELLGSFVREMKVLVMAGAWCGDCVEQCPIFEHFAACTKTISIRYVDRDDSHGLSSELLTCGAPRVPAVVFLSEDGQFCARAGDRTLTKYRSVMQQFGGPSCPTGFGTSADLTSAVVQDWLDEFERVQWMLRTSGRLRQLHGD